MSPNWRNEICTLVAILVLTRWRTVPLSFGCREVLLSHQSPEVACGQVLNKIGSFLGQDFLSFSHSWEMVCLIKKNAKYKRRKLNKMSHWEIRALYLGMFISLRLLKRMFLFVARITMVDSVASILFAFGFAFLEKRLASSSHISWCRNRTKQGRGCRGLWLEAACRGRGSRALSTVVLPSSDGGWVLLPLLHLWGLGCHFPAL